MSDPLQLKCGNPETPDNPASFSRFVLPFAYRLAQLTSTTTQGLCYQPKQDNTTQRKKYLTNETALVLFERAKWFAINPQAWQQTAWGKDYQVNEEDKKIKVKLKTDNEFHIKMLPPLFGAI